MKVARYPQKVFTRKSTLILGAFEAFHMGHIALIEAAKKLSLPITLMMIENTLALPGKHVEAYCEFSTRLIQAANLGIDQVIVLSFTEEIRNMNGIDFFNKMVDLANAKNVVVGHDFAMGFNRELTAPKILEMFPSTTIVDPVKFNNLKLSTTTLKELVQVGDVNVIKKLSPFSYTITTRVTTDKTFEFATIKPQRGIYAAFAVVNEIKYWCLVQIGFGKNVIYVPDLLIVNANFDARIEMRKLTRIIIRADQDHISENDKDQVIDYLSKNSN